ncbi:thioredoxin-like domain-containing protein [Bacteroidota bacterium]
MKTHSLLLLILISIFIASCGSIQQQDKTVILNGKIQNPADEFVIFRVADLQDYLIEDTVSLNDDGSFYTSLEIHDCRPVTFYDGKESSQMYVCPGDSIYITMNTEEFDESMHYEGIGAKKNNILAEYYLKFKDADNEEYVSFYAIRDTSIDIFMELVKKNSNASKAYFNDVKASGDLPENFLKYMETELYFKPILDNQNVYYSKNKDTTDEYKEKLNTIGELTLKAVDFQDADMLNQNYKTWLGYYVKNQIRREIQKDLGDVDKEQYDSIFYNYLENTLTAEQMQFFVLKEADRFSYSYDVDKFEEMLPLVDIYVTDKKYNDAIYAQFDEVVRKVNQPLPEDATLFNLDDEELLDLTFDDVLAKYKGNVIYLDFWASWCGPCKAEMPNSAKLSKKLKDEAVVFLYCSTDRDPDAWERMIRIMQLHGLHYRLGKNTRKPVFEEYGIRYIPHYVIFDKKGKMVKNNMTRPGDAETEKMIRELLEK